MKGSASTESKRYTVNMQRRTCSCSFFAIHRIPCEHVLVVSDKLDCRITPELNDTFRKQWIAPYFWAENYIDAYNKEFVVPPDMDGSDKLNLPNDARRVTKPYMKTKNKKRNPTKRKTKGEGGRRSRGKFNPEEYQQSKRHQYSRVGPANPFVRISNPDIFKKKPCGRKGLTFAERSEGSERVRKRLEEVISERKKNRPRSVRQSKQKKRKKTRRTQVNEPQSSTSIPVVTTPYFPTFDLSGSTRENLDTPVPIITTPYFPTFDMGVYLGQSMIPGFPLIPQSYPMILPKPFI